MFRARTAALLALAVPGLAACAGGSEGDEQAAVRSAAPGNCPGDVLEVVVSVAQWSDVAGLLAGDCANVTTLVASAAADPHSFEPTTGDLVRFSDADLVVVNGAGYDGWAESAVADLDEQPAVVSAAEVAGLESAGEEHSEGEDPATGPVGVDPHLWYAPDVVQAVAAEVTEQLTELSPDAAGYFAEQQSAWTAQLQPYLDAIEELRALAGGRSYAATEAVFDRMAAAIGLTDATPEGYRRSVSNESEPAPGELTAFTGTLSDREADVLVHNAQTAGSIPEQLRDAAEEAGVPVVEVTESAPSTDGAFVEWQLAQLSALSDALAPAP